MFYSLISWETARAQNLVSISDKLSSEVRDFSISSASKKNSDKPQEIAGITITETDNTAVKEGGYSDTYSIVLDCIPDPITATVTITQTSEDGQLQDLDPTTITFDKDNWDEPQTVTVRAVDDSEKEGTNSDNILFVVSATTYSNYYGISIDPLDVTIYDNDTPGVTITETSGSTGVKENGYDDTYTIVLDSPPDPITATITVNQFSKYGQLKPFDTITFTEDNWDEPQTVTVKAVDDTESEGVHTDKIQIFITSTPYSNYFGISVTDIDVTIYDNDYKIYQPLVVKGEEYLIDCLFIDNFNDRNHDWYVVPQVYYETEMDGNEYFLRHWLKNSTVLSTAPFASSNITDYYSVSLDARLTADSDLKSRLGVIFELVSQDNFYTFLISPETQEWWLHKVHNQWEMISSGTSDVIQENNESNQLKIFRNRSTGLIQVFVNGTQLWSGIDASLINGKTGVILLTKSTLQDTSEAAFDNFIINEEE